MPPRRRQISGIVSSDFASLITKTDFALESPAFWAKSIPRGGCANMVPVEPPIPSNER